MTFATQRASEFASRIPTLPADLAAKAANNQTTDEDEAALAVHIKAACEALRGFGPRRREDRVEEVDVREYNVRISRGNLVAT